MTNEVRSSAYLDGWHAQRAGMPEIVCPYDRLVQARSRFQWMQGWRDRNAARQHGGDLSLDDGLFR